MGPPSTAQACSGAVRILVSVDPRAGSRYPNYELTIPEQNVSRQLLISSLIPTAAVALCMVYSQTLGPGSEIRVSSFRNLACQRENEHSTLVTGFNEICQGRVATFSCRTELAARAIATS